MESKNVNSKVKSEHIQKIVFLCQQNNVEELYDGKDIYNQTKEGEWMFFDCYFDEKKLRKRLNLPDIVRYYEYDGRTSGQESGFIDEHTNDAVLGYHPLYGKIFDKKKIE